jgi:hypothetical protein
MLLESPLRTPKTHEANARRVKQSVKAFGGHKLADLSAMRSRVPALSIAAACETEDQGGSVERGVLKPSAVHQEFRVLRRILNISRSQKAVPSTPAGASSYLWR